MTRTGIVGGHSRFDFDVLLLLVLVVVSATQAISCQFPCNASGECNEIDISVCEHGLVKDVCECCDVCGKGPNEWCGPYGKCGDGLECVELSGVSVCAELPSPSTSEHAC